MDRELRRQLIDDRAAIERELREVEEYDEESIARMLQGYDIAIRALGQEH